MYFKTAIVGKHEFNLGQGREFCYYNTMSNDVMSNIFKSIDCDFVLRT